MPNTIRPVEVDVSTPSRSDRNTIPRSPNVFTVCTIPDRLRPKRSSATTVTVSPARAYAINSAKPGRSSRVPDIVSVNTRPETPAAAKASSC